MNLPTIQEVVWQQSLDTSGRDPPTTNTNENLKTEITMTESAQQTSPPHKVSKVSGTDPDHIPDETRTCLGQSPKSSQKNECQPKAVTKTSSTSRDDIAPSPLTVSSLITDNLIQDDETKELYLPINASVTLKQKKKMLYVPIDFSHGVTIDALVDSGAYVSAIPEDELERIKTYSRSNILKMGDPPAFQIQVANGQLEKPTAIATMWFEIGDFEFAEHFVVMRNLTGPIIGLHFMRHNSVVLDITHGVLHFPLIHASQVSG